MREGPVSPTQRHLQQSSQQAGTAGEEEERREQDQGDGGVERVIDGREGLQIGKERQKQDVTRAAPAGDAPKVEERQGEPLHRLHLHFWQQAETVSVEYEDNADQ